MSRDEKGSDVKSPIQWLLGACLTLLVCAIALSLVVSLLAAIWPWLLLIALIGGGGALAYRIAANRRRNW